MSESWGDVSLPSHPTVQEIAVAYLSGALGPLHAAVQLLKTINPQHPLWDATKGFEGPLVALYIASDEVDRIGYIGNDPEWWHSDVRAVKQADLAKAEKRLAASIQAACRAILAPGSLI